MNKAWLDWLCALFCFLQAALTLAKVWWEFKEARQDMKPQWGRWFRRR